MGCQLQGGRASSADHLFLADEGALGLPPRMPSFGRDLLGAAAAGSAEPPPAQPQPLPRLRLGTIPRRFSQSSIRPVSATAAAAGDSRPSSATAAAAGVDAPLSVDASMSEPADASMLEPTGGCAAFRASDPLLRQPLFSPVSSPTVTAAPDTHFAAQSVMSSAERELSGTTRTLTASEAPSEDWGSTWAIPQGNRTVTLPSSSRFMPTGLGRIGEGGEAAGRGAAADTGRASSVPTPETNSSLPFTFAPLSLASARASTSVPFLAMMTGGGPAAGAPVPSWPCGGGGGRPGSLFPAAPMSVDPADLVDQADPEASPSRGDLKRRRLFGSAGRQPLSARETAEEAHPASDREPPAEADGGSGVLAGIQDMRRGAASSGGTSRVAVPEPPRAAAAQRLAVPGGSKPMAASPAGVPACLAVGAARAGIPQDDGMPSSSSIQGDVGPEVDPAICWAEAEAGSAAAGSRDENTDPEQDRHALELTSRGDDGGRVSASGAMAMELVAASGAAMHGGGSCSEEQPSAIKASPRWVGDLFRCHIYEALHGTDGRNHIKRSLMGETLSAYSRFVPLQAETGPHPR